VLGPDWVEETGNISVKRLRKAGAQGALLNVVVTLDAVGFMKIYCHYCSDILYEALMHVEYAAT